MCRCRRVCRICVWRCAITEKCVRHRLCSNNRLTWALRQLIVSGGAQRRGANYIRKPVSDAGAHTHTNKCRSQACVLGFSENGAGASSVPGRAPAPVSCPSAPTHMWHTDLLGRGRRGWQQKLGKSYELVAELPPTNRPCHSTAPALSVIQAPVPTSALRQCKALGHP